MALVAAGQLCESAAAGQLWEIQALVAAGLQVCSHGQLALPGLVWLQEVAWGPLLRSGPLLRQALMHARLGSWLLGQALMQMLSCRAAFLIEPPLHQEACSAFRSSRTSEAGTLPSRHLHHMPASRCWRQNLSHKTRVQLAQKFKSCSHIPHI